MKSLSKLHCLPNAISVKNTLSGRAWSEATGEVYHWPQHGDLLPKSRGESSETNSLPRHHQGRPVEELCYGRWAGLDEVIAWEAMMPLLSFSKEELLELHYQDGQTGVVHLWAQSDSCAGNTAAQDEVQQASSALMFLFTRRNRNRQTLL